MVLDLRLPKPRILYFDIENRPLSFIGPDYTSSDITAIAATFGPDEVFDTYEVHCWLLGEHSQKEMLREFSKMWDEADIVTGHYILMHDIPIIQGALAEHKLPGLAEKRVSDTKIHLRKFKGISKSQESLSEVLGGDAPKEHMTPQQWRKANRLENIWETRRRVIGDVVQHIEMRRNLVERGLLNPPMHWTP